MATVKKELRKKGTVWSVRWYDEQGSERKKSFRLKVEAEEHAAMVKLGLQPPADEILSPPQDQEMLFSEFMATWLNEHCRVHVSKATQIDYESIIETHIKPTLGAKKLSELRRVDMKNLQAKLSKERGLNPKTINNVTNLAHKIMHDCVVDWELLEHNPFFGYTRLRVTPAPFAFWEVDERDKFLAYCLQHHPDDHDFFAVALHSGGRFGELEALRGGSLNHQVRQLTFRQKYNPKTSQFDDFLKMGKKQRQVPMNSFLLEVLGKYRFFPADRLLFPLKLRRDRRQVFEDCIKGAGVKRIKFHEMRHTFASNLARAGMSIQMIQALLGHSNVSQTQRYAHLSPDAFVDATEVLVRPKEAMLMAVSGSS